MARMIDADVASKRFRGWLEGPHEASEYNSGFDDAIYRVLDVIDHMPTLTQPNKLERAGLYGKYTVLKNEDGSLVTNCFVLRPEKDPAAVAALRAYAATTDNAELADDIINWVGAELPEPPGKERSR